MSEEDRLSAGWALTTIGELGWVTKLAGFEFTKFVKYREMGSVRVVRGLNVGYGEFRAADFKYIDYATSDALPRSQLHGGELLIAYVGSLGTATVLPFDGYRYHLGPNVAKVVAQPAACEAKYLLYFVLSPNGQHQIHFTSKAVAQSSLSMQQIRGFSVPLAPINEQRRIVAAIEQQFTRLEAGVAALRRARAALKRYRAAVLKAAVEGRLTEAWRTEHPDAEPASALLARILTERRAQWEADQRAKGKDPAKTRYEEPAAPDAASLPELPVGWVWATVEQVSTSVRYGTSAKTSEDSCGVPVLRMGNIQEGRLDLSNLKYLPIHHKEFPDLLLGDGDLLFNRTNSAELVGKSAVYRDSPSPCSFASYLIAVRMVPRCLPDYLCYYLNSVYGRAWVASVVSQQVGQANVNGTKLQALAFPLPPLAEQEAIVAEVERRLSVVGELEAAVAANLKRAERLRQAILREAFAGQLVAQDPNDEPASALLERIRREREERAQANGRNGQGTRRHPTGGALVEAQARLWEE